MNWVQDGECLVSYFGDANDAGLVQSVARIDVKDLD